MKGWFFSIIDFFQNSIWLSKLSFLPSLSQNFSTICTHMLSKFVDKSAQKLSIFSIKASFERSLIISVVVSFPFSLLSGLEYKGEGRSNLHVFCDKIKMGEECARRMADLISKNNSLGLPTVLGLATGSTPIPVYEAFIKIVQEEEIDLSEVITFNLDEYCGLPLDHPQSYHSFMFSHLFEALLASPTNPKGLKSENIHIPNGYAKQISDLSKKEVLRFIEKYPRRPKTFFLSEEEEAWVLNERATDYDSLIKEKGPVHLQLLGIGENGHIGFAEPGSFFEGRTAVVVLSDNTRKNNSRFFEDQMEEVPLYAITMGIGTIKEAEEIYLLATGENKANIVEVAAKGALTSDIPATALQIHPQTSFFLDSKASSEIEHSSVFCYYNGKVLKNHDLVEEDFWIFNGSVVAPQEQADYKVDVEGKIIAPGYIDLQINGGFGVDFSVHPERVDYVAESLPQYGVTAFLPTIISIDKKGYPGFIQHLQPHKCKRGATILGVHLEGPYFAPGKQGAHKKEFILPFEFSLQECYGDLTGVKIVTLAPEIPGALEAIKTLTTMGIVVSAGHTNALYEEMQEAVEAGVTMATHLFNAMTPLHHRTPGIAEAVLTNGDIAYSVIADGVHVHSAMIELAWRANPQGFFLVTDAIEALGLPAGAYHLGEMDVEVGEEAAYLLGTKTIAGSILSMDKAVRFFQKSTGCSLVDAIEAASLKPAQILGIENYKGDLKEGADADFLFLNESLEIQASFIAGEIVWEK